MLNRYEIQKTDIFGGRSDGLFSGQASGASFASSSSSSSSSSSWRSAVWSTDEMPMALSFTASSSSSGSGGSVGGTASFDVIADNLANPRGLTFGPNGELFILETGIGPAGGIGSGGTVVGFLPGFISLESGDTAAIQTLDLEGAGGLDELLGGLPSLREFFEPDIGRILAAGSNDILIQGDDIFIPVGSGLTGADADLLNQTEDLYGFLLKVEGALDGDASDATVTAGFDFAGYEAANNNDGSTRFLGNVSTPFSITNFQDTIVVGDSGANTVYFLEDDGVTLRNISVLPTQTVTLPDNSQAIIEAVPTSAVVGPDGALYVGELTGIPYTDGIARVWRYDSPSATPTVYATGFSQIIDLAFDAEGNMFVLEYMNANTVYDPSVAIEDYPPSRLVKVAPDGTREVISGDELVLGTGLWVDPEGDVVVAINGGGIEDGEIIRYDLDGDPFNNGVGVGEDALEGNDNINGGFGDDVLGGRLGDDDINGGDGDDSLFGGAGDDDLKGDRGHDTVFGQEGDDHLKGGDGDDHLDGGDGVDQIKAGRGNDTLFGGDGDDDLRGEDGDDILDGGDGDDLLKGGRDDDTFVFGLGDDADDITDFDAADDTIRLEGFGSYFDSYQEVIAAASEIGHDVVIDFGGGDTLTLSGAELADLSASDFVFA